MTHTFERAERVEPEEARRFAAIYEESFPPAERDDTGDLLASIAAGERLCYLARLDGVVVGLAVAFALRGPSVVLLEYLAVDAAAREAGVGGALLEHLRRELGSDPDGKHRIVLEVEAPDEVDGAERALRRRRLAFYLRHGASVVECAPRYRAPDLEREDGSVRFTLLSIPLSADAAPALTGAELRACIVAILTQSYELSPDAPLVRDVVDELVC
jgi:ribosomal protein S18 acetylase RimI-like enzyme